MKLCTKLLTLVILIVSVAIPLVINYVPVHVIVLHIEMVKSAFDSLSLPSTRFKAGASDYPSSSSLVSTPALTAYQTLREMLKCPEPPLKLTLEQLSQYTDPSLPHPDPALAHCPRPLLLALDSIIFDVTEGTNFYGPKGPYKVFAGKSCAKALTIGSLEEEDMTDDFSGMSEKELKAVQKQVEFYRGKYTEVGKVV